jgi:hypothetical protein
MRMEPRHWQRQHAESDHLRRTMHYQRIHNEGKLCVVLKMFGQHGSYSRPQR